MIYMMMSPGASKGLKSPPRIALVLPSAGGDGGAAEAPHRVGRRVAKSGSVSLR